MASWRDVPKRTDLGISKKQGRLGTDTTGVYQDYQHGRTPVIAWNCDTLANIINGNSSDIAYLNNEAQQIAKYPGHVFIRWFWEMNINDTYKGTWPNGSYGTQPGGTWTANGNNCLNLSEPPTGATGSNAADFITAWTTIWTIFNNNNVTNVTWLFNPDDSVNSSGQRNYQDPRQMYPTGYVDWIGNDSYDKAFFSGDEFSSVMSNFYTDFSSYGKPLFIAETGGETALAGCQSTSNQQAYLASAQHDLDAGAFPDIKAFMYFDAPGGDSCWPLDNDGGLTQFTSIANDAQFGAVATGTVKTYSGKASSLTITPSPAYPVGTVLLAYLSIYAGTQSQNVHSPGAWQTVGTTFWNKTNLTGATQTVYVHVVTASDSQYTWTWTTSHDYGLLLVPVTGINTTTPLDTAATQGIAGTTSSVSSVSASISPSLGGEYLVGFFNGFYNGFSPGTNGTGTSTWTNSSVYNQWTYANTFFAYNPLGTADSSIPVQFTWNSPNTFYTASLTAALIPASRP